MILYPTETIYALGANALDEGEIEKLYVLKGREMEKGSSWLVRDVADIEKYGELSEMAAKIAAQFLPGSLTLVLPAKDTVPEGCRSGDGTVSFRISPDPTAQKLIAQFMSEHDAPLTCTSANVSGMSPESTSKKIIEQLKSAGKDISLIDRVVDGGPRTGEPSTVVRVIGNKVEVLREGVIQAADILRFVV